jgi:tetratricopeptide (TPR) repeat protein
LRLLLFLLAVSVLASAQAAQEPPTAPWKIADAPYRVVVRQASEPNTPEAGFEITLPEFGQTRPDLADLLLTDAKGTPLPLAKIGRRTGGRVLLLAQKLEPKTPYYLYFGGGNVRVSPLWVPKVSLLMETRPAPADLTFDSYKEVKSAWDQSTDEPGADFVSQIYQGGNLFGPSFNFLTHYTGYLRLPKAREITFYTLSSDCSFVKVNDQLEFGWPGRHSPYTKPETLSKKAIQCAGGLVKIDYYAAKGDLGPEATLEAATVLGWQTDTGFEAIPKDVWAHPGTTQLSPVQSADGPWVPLARANVESFLAYANQWFYETRIELRPPQSADAWSATWEFEDGASVSGTGGVHLLTGKESQMIQCKLTRNSDGKTLKELFRVDVPERLQRASINSQGDTRRYLDLIAAEAVQKLNPAAVRARLVLLCDYGTDQEVAQYGAKWAETNQNDELWLRVRGAGIRADAQADPAKAKQELLDLLQTMEPAPRQVYAAYLGMMEVDLLVFCLRDPDAFGRITQIAFLNAGTDLDRTAKIRLGDLHRLLGHTKEAAAQYRSLEPQKPSLSQAAKDSAASLQLNDLLDKGFIREAQLKLNEWELRRPMVKFDTEFLLLHARSLLLLGRWSEALAELDSFGQVQPDSPFQTDAQYYRALALYTKGDKEEARKLWNDFTKDYPRHRLTPEARNWAKKP